MLVNQPLMPTAEETATSSSIIRRGWMLLLITALALLPHVALYTVNNSSGSFRVLVVGFVFLALVSAGLAVWTLRGQRGIDAIRQRAAGWRTPYIIASVILCTAYGINMRPEWVYAHVGLTLALLLTLSYVALFDGVPRISPIGWIGIGVSVVAATLVRVYALSYYPSQNITDESWVLGWALSFLRDGYFHDLVNYYGGADIQRFMLPVAWWISLFGSDFWQVRVFFFLCTLLVIILGGLAARNLYGSGKIALLVMFSSAVVMSGARLRHDVGLAIAVAASIWLWSEAIKRNKGWLHLLAGLAIGLGMFAHYHATFLGAALFLGLYVPRWIQSRRLIPERSTWLFIAGGLIGVALMIVLQIIPDWQGFIAVRRPRNPPMFVDYINMFIDHIKNVFEHSRYEFLLIVVALIAALRRRTQWDVAMVIMLIAAHIGLGIFTPLALLYYIVPLAPLYGLLVAGLFERGFSSLPVSLRSIGAACFLSVGLGFTLSAPAFALRNRAPVALPEPPAIAWIRENVSPDELLVTEHFYFLFLTDYHFVSPMTPEYMQPQFRPQFEEAARTLDVTDIHRGRTDVRLDQYTFRSAVWDEIAPDVVIIDPNLSTCCVPPILDEPYLISRGYQLVATIEGGELPVLVYRKGDS